MPQPNHTKNYTQVLFSDGPEIIRISVGGRKIALTEYDERQLYDWLRLRRLEPRLAPKELSLIGTDDHGLYR